MRKNIRDEMIWIRPKCANGCDKSAFALVGRKLICGDCLIKIDKKIKVMIMEGENAH